MHEIKNNAPKDFFSIPRPDHFHDRSIQEHHAIIDHWRRSPDGRARQMPPNQLAFVRRQTVQVAAVTADVNAIILDDRAGPETILLFGLLVQSAFSLISPNQFSRFLFVAADNSIFGGRINKAINDGRS